ncbi:hypothetical protein VHEMI00443 [[Torrubiella] hemipterigena]|uniref:MARVEL domain-containing protein n=1 Tax=[Torrubiella] hemipterigena TaxID=1531966 RepID=A0A0A1T1Y6_9HYPO|nr:hypothetical protein VHEMI00443 [[Torrubiella] hemipterigena]
MAIDRIFSMILRGSELVFAAVIAGVNGQYLYRSKASTLFLSRFIYTEVVAGISILLALIWLIPFSSTFTHWPVDILISVLWWASFGALVHFVGDNCGAVFDWGNVSPRGNLCGKFKTSIAFAFLSALIWLISAFVGIYWIRRRDRTANRVQGRQWFPRRTRPAVV